MRAGDGARRARPATAERARGGKHRSAEADRPNAWTRGVERDEHRGRPMTGSRAWWRGDVVERTGERGDCARRGARRDISPPDATARTGTAVSARKAGTFCGLGRGDGRQGEVKQRSGATGLAEARKRRARSARGVSRRRVREKGNIVNTLRRRGRRRRRRRGQSTRSWGVAR